jgi:hypothetical protein
MDRGMELIQQPYQRLVLIVDFLDTYTQFVTPLH